MFLVILVIQIHHITLAHCPWSNGSIEVVGKAFLRCVRGLLSEFQLVCGECSPMPVFEMCGLGGSFPDESSQCNTEHCAEVLIPWFDASFEVCEADLTAMGADADRMQQLRDFYARCTEASAAAAAAAEPVPECDPIFLGEDVGFANVFEYHDEDGTCKLSMSELAHVCGTKYLACLAFLRDSEPDPEPAPERTEFRADFVADRVLASVQEYAVDGVQGYTTVRLVVELQSGATNLYSIAGTEAQAMIFPPAWHKAVPFGAHVGGVDAAFFAVAPDAEYDSWLTVGVTNGAQPVPSSIGVDFDSWDETTGIETTNGAIFWMDPSGGPAAGAPIVVAQLTMPTGTLFTAKMLMQGRSAEGEEDWDELHVEFSTVPTEASTGNPSCDPVYLGPDIGSVNIYEYHDEDGSCSLSMTELASVCAERYAECVSFLDSSDEANDPTAGDPPAAGVELFTATGWFLMSASPDVLDIGGEAEVLFVSLFREDVSSSLGIRFDYVSVTEIKAATEGETGDSIHVHVNYGVVAEVKEAAALELLQNLEMQAGDSSSALMYGVVTYTIEQAGEDPMELQLHTCEPVFLGPDIGYANVMEYHMDDGSCTLSMPQLATVCSAFFAECMSFLASSEEPSEPEPRGTG